MATKDEKYILMDKFIAYVTKSDPSKTAPGVLVEGSKNVFFVDAEKIVKATGYILDGQPGTLDTPIESSTVWDTHKNITIPLRAFKGPSNTGKLQVRYIKTGTTEPVWYDLMTGLSDTQIPISYTKWWDLNDKSDYLVWCYGTPNMSYWKGVISEVVSNTASTLTVTDGTRYANSGSVVVDGTNYPYTGKTGNQLTGMSSLPAFTAGTPVFSGVLAANNYPDTSFNTTTVYTLNNQMYFESDTSQDVFVTQGSSASAGALPSVAYSTPVRKPGEGNKFQLDSVGIGIISDDDTIYISAGRNEWYQLQKLLTSDGTGESFKIKKLRTGEMQGAISQNSIAGTKYGIAVCTKEKTIDTLQNITSVEGGSVQRIAISDPISNLLEKSSFLGGVYLKYHKNYLVASIPSEGYILFYDMVMGRWEAPYTVPVKSLEVIDGELYGHSSIKNETYKLLTGKSFNGSNIQSIIRFAYLTYGDRGSLKNLDEIYSEFILDTQTTVDILLRYEYDGAEANKTFSLTGSGKDDAYRVGVFEDGSLGKYPLGFRPIGGGGSEVTLSKFRKIFQTNSGDPFYELQIEISEESDDGYFELLAVGPNVQKSLVNNQSVKS